MLEVIKAIKQTNDKYITFIADKDLAITYKVTTIITLGKRGKYLFDSTVDPKVNTRTILSTTREELAKLVDKAARARKVVVETAEKYIKEEIFKEIFIEK